MKHGSLRLSNAITAFPAAASASAALLTLILIPSASSAAIYKCTAQDGTTIYADASCGPHAQGVRVESSTPSHVPSLASSPPAPWQAQINESLERMATQCETAEYNNWHRIKNPKPSPDEEIAKLKEIKQKCRANLPLQHALPMRPVTVTPPEMNTSNSPQAAPAPQAPPAPTGASPPTTVQLTPEFLIIPPKPILSGPAGDTAAAKLAELVKSGSIDRLQKYLSLPDVDINDRPGTDEALLDYAAEQNQAKVAQYLIDHGALIDAIQTQGPNRGLSALHRAATVDAAGVAELLLAHGASAGRLGPSGITPLILAASNGSRRTAELLLDHGADVLTLMPSGNRTALSEAIAHGHKDIVRLVLLHVSANTVKDIISVAGRGDRDTLRLILMHDELVHDVDASSKDQALRFTLLGGPGGFEERKQMIELLLAHGADIDHYPIGTVEIPLMSATTPDMIEFMLAHGANQKAKFPGAQLAMAYVCNKNVKDPLGALQVLVSHGIDIGGRPLPRSYSAMECATRSGNAVVLQFLKDHGAGEGGTVQAAVRTTPVGHTLSPMSQAGSSPDNTGMHCAITQYSQWIRVQTTLPEPEVKARKLQEIDTLCGSSLHLANVQSSAEATLSAAQTPNSSPPTAMMTVPVKSSATVAKERRASEVLTALNKDAILSSANGNLNGRAHQLAPYFLKKLDPSNTNWNDRNPGWPIMAGIVEKDLLEEISDKPTNETLNIETAAVGAYAAKMTDDDLRQMATYLASPEGKRYAAFQTQIELVFNEGIRALQSNHPQSQEPVADVVQKRRLQLLALSDSAMILVAQYDIAQSQHADISGFSALPIMMEATAMIEAPQLDALATHFDADIPRFVSFSQTGTAKHHFAALAAAQTVGAPLLLALVEEFARKVEARHMTHWQQVYKERVVHSD